MKTIKIDRREQTITMDGIDITEKCLGTASFSELGYIWQIAEQLIDMGIADDYDDFVEAGICRRCVAVLTEKDGDHECCWECRWALKRLDDCHADDELRGY